MAVEPGSGFDKLATTVGGILQDRFDVKQAEDFMANELSQFNAQTKAFYEGLGTIESGDQLAQAFQSWTSETFMPFVTQASMKYARNGRIMNIVKQMDEANRNGLAQFLNVEQAGHNLAGRPEAEKMEKEKNQAEIALKGAQTKEAEAQAGYYNRMPQKASSGSDKNNPMEMFLTGPPNISPAEARIFAMDARLPKEKEAVDSRTLEAAALRYIEDNRGMPRPDGLTWGEVGADSEDGKTKSDVTLAADKLKRSANFRKTIEAGRLVHERGPEYLNQFQGYYDDVAPFFNGSGSPLLPEEIGDKLKGAQPTENILSVLLGLPKKSLRSTGFSTSTIEDFITNDVARMETPEQMGDLPASVYKSSIKPQASGPALNARTGEPIQTYQDVVKALAFEWERRVTGNLVADEGPSKAQLRKLGEAYAAKFAAKKAIELGIEVPKNTTILGSIANHIADRISLFGQLRSLGGAKTDALAEELELLGGNDKEINKVLRKAEKEVRTINNKKVEIINTVSRKKKPSNKDIRLLQNINREDEEEL